MLAIFISNYSNIYWKLTKDISADEDLEVEVEKPAEPIKSALTLRLLDMGSSPHTVGSKDINTPAESIQRGNTFSTSLKNINFMPGQVRTPSKRALTTRPTSPTFKLSGIIMASKAINKFRFMLKKGKTLIPFTPRAVTPPKFMKLNAIRNLSEQYFEDNLQNMKSLSNRKIDNLSFEQNLKTDKATELNKPYRVQRSGKDTIEDMAEIEDNDIKQSMRGSGRSLAHIPFPQERPPQQTNIQSCHLPPIFKLNLPIDYKNSVEVSENSAENNTDHRAFEFEAKQKLYSSSISHQRSSDQMSPINSKLKAAVVYRI